MTELEIQLAHVQRLYEQLDEVVTAQATQTDRMQRRIVQLAVGSSDDAPPPVPGELARSTFLTTA